MYGNDERLEFKAENVGSRDDDTERNDENCGTTEHDGRQKESWLQKIMPWRWFSDRKKESLRKRRYLSSRKLQAQRLRLKSLRRTRLRRRRLMLSGQRDGRRRRPARSLTSLRSRRVLRPRLDGRAVLRTRTRGHKSRRPCPRKNIRTSRESSSLRRRVRRQRIHQLSKKNTGKTVHFAYQSLGRYRGKKSTLKGRPTKKPRGIRFEARRFKRRYSPGWCLSKSHKTNYLKEPRIRKLPKGIVKE